MHKIKQEKIANIRQLRNDGESIKVIAKQINCSPATVKKYTDDIELTVEQKMKLISRFGKRTFDKVKVTNEKSNNLIRSCDIGDFVETSCIAAFIGLGYTVSIPFGCGSRYDLIVDDGDTLIKVQCKLGKIIKNNRFKFQCMNVAYGGKKKNYQGEVDIFAVYLIELDTVYIFNVKDVPKTVCITWFIDNVPYKNRRIAKNHILCEDKHLLDY